MASFEQTVYFAAATNFPAVLPKEIKENQRKVLKEIVIPNSIPRKMLAPDYNLQGQEPYETEVNIQFTR